MNNLSLIKKIVGTIVFSVLIFIFSAYEANASHFRYGNISWKQVPNNANAIEFKISQAWRRSYFGSPMIGSIINSGSFNSGVSNHTINLEITSINVAEDWFYGEYSVVVTYPGPGTYNALFGGCCRISSLTNNRDLDFAIRSTVTVGNNNDAPITTISPYINLSIGNALATYQLQSTDPNGDSLTYSLTPNGNFGSGTVQPPGLSVSPSGLITFNTAAPGVNVGNLYNSNITVQDSRGAKTVIDFIIKVTAPSTPPVYDYTVTPANSMFFTVLPGQNLTFPLKATDADAGQTVNITGTGLPIGSAFNSVDGNPAQATFSWTPTIADLGVYVLNFNAMDNVGVSTPTVVVLNVTADPRFDAPTPGNNSIFCVVPGNNLSYDYHASDPDSTDTLTLQVLSGLMPGMSFTPSLPITAPEMLSSSFSWTPTAAQWGARLLTMRVMDKFGVNNDHTTHILVNHPPAITSSPITSTLVGSIYSYLVTTSDLDIPYGDIVGIESVILPSFLSIVDNGNGTFTISGTPAISDVGVHSIKVEIEDELNHYQGTHCGNAYQIFDLEVLPCDITTTITGTTNNNIPGHPNTIIYKGYGNQSAILSATTNGAGMIQYNWSTGATTQNITVSPNVTTEYTLVITDANGCKDTAYYTVPVIDVRCGNKNDKVKLCHKTGNGYNEICVAPAAVAAHLAHGDMLGACQNAISGTALVTTEPTLKIYPNPSDDNVTISLSVMPTNAVIQLVDVNGRVVFTEKITNQKTQISLKDFSAGWYMINVIDDGYVLRDKILKL